MTRFVDLNKWHCRPELLQHPNIPKPLHGLNPRTIKGVDWWDVTRHKAYAKHSFHCYACGVHSRQAPSRPERNGGLEAHEDYIIDWAKGVMTIKEIVALCYYCHAFIHSGLLWINLSEGRITTSEFRRIMTHGLVILREAGLRPSIDTVYVHCTFLGDSFEVAMKMALELGHDDGRICVPPKWEDWRLRLEGTEYKPLFPSYEAWKEHYGN